MNPPLATFSFSSYKCIFLENSYNLGNFFDALAVPSRGILLYGLHCPSYACLIFVIIFLRTGGKAASLTLAPLSLTYLRIAVFLILNRHVILRGFNSRISYIGSKIFVSLTVLFINIAVSLLLSKNPLE